VPKVNYTMKEQEMFARKQYLVGVTLAVAIAACSSPVVSGGAPADDQTSQPIVNEATIYAKSPGAISAKHDLLGGLLGGVGGAVQGVLSGPLAPLCLALPDSLVMDVGPKGATFSALGNTVVFPKNAVSQTTHIVMLPDLGTTMAVRFYPEGLVFNPWAQPTLTINTDCIGNPANDRIDYTDDAGNVLEPRPTKGKDAHSITTTIAHFSRYAVDW
jgi:hypothetical protein